MTLDDLRAKAILWKEPETATVVCPACGKSCLDAFLNGEGQVIDAACSHCDYNYALRLEPEVMALKEFATKVFESMHKAEKWLNQPHEFTDGLSPIEYSSTKERIELINEKLIQIDHGHSA